MRKIGDTSGVKNLAEIESYLLGLKNPKVNDDFYHKKDNIIEITKAKVNKSIDPVNCSEDEKITYLTTILNNITDNNSNEVTIDLNSIGIVQFNKLYFGEGTSYGKVSGRHLLRKFFLFNTKGLKNLLELGGISKIDKKIILPPSDYIKIILNSATDKNGNKKEVDLQSITLREFSSLYFGHSINYGIISGAELLNKMSVDNKKISLRLIIELYGVERGDLPLELIDYNNHEHIDEILAVVTNKDGEIQNRNPFSIGVYEFKDLYFGYGTRFGSFKGSRLLMNYGGKYTNEVLNELLSLGAI